MSFRSLSPEQQRLLARRLDEAGVGRREPIPARTGDPGRAPLSPAQERLYFVEQVRPGTALYVMAGMLRMRGEVDVGDLGRALNLLVDRHEALRTSFETDAGGAVAQVVAGPGSVRVRMDVEDTTSAALPDRVRDLRRRTFDLTAAPLMRAVALRVTDAPGPELALVLSLHHLVADGWSLGVLQEELGVAYDAVRAGVPPPLPDLPLRYTDVAVWQRERAAGAEHDRQLAFWRDELDGYVPFDLPADRVPRADMSPAGDVADVHLPAGVLDRLRVAGGGGRGRPTLFAVLTAAWSVVLGRWSGARDVVLGTAAAGRQRAELEGLVGFFVNTVPLRVALRPDEGFADLAGRVNEVCRNAFAHQDVPFDRLVAHLHPGRESSGRSPIVRHLVVLHTTAPAAAALTGVHTELVGLHTGTAKFDLELQLTPHADGAVSGWLEYSTDLFDRASVERLVGALRQVLAAAAAEPAGPVGDLPLLGADDRRELERLSGAGAGPYPFVDLVRRFEDRAATDPDADAVVDPDGRVTGYAELDRLADALAAHLRAAGVGVEDRVGVSLPRGRDLMVAVLGTLKAGAAYVPLDPDQPADRLRSMIADAGAAVVLAGPDPAAVSGVPGVRVVDVAGLDLPPAPRATVPVDGAGAAYVLFTSGSTGRPKGAVNTRAGIANRIAWMQDRYGLTPADRVLQKTPIGFDVSVWELLWPLVTGAALVFLAPGGHRSPEHLHDVLDRERITTCHFVPSMLRAFLDAPARPHPGLRRILCSGEELPAALAARCRTALPDAELHNLYGPTEAAVDVTAFAVSGGPRDRIPIGRPITGAELYVLDARYRPQPVGVPGDLYIGGVQLARGYSGRPGLTAERFVPHPFGRGTRLYATGDRARWLDDGNLEFLGRSDTQVKIRGNRVEPAEVELVLGGFPEVAAAHVTTGPGPDGEVELLAYVAAAGRTGGGELAGAQVAQWTSVFDELYGGSARPADPAFDVSGWISTYTGEAIPDDEMRDWVDATVARVTALRPDRVLEIGCGTGLMLHRIAPGCAHYEGTDVSAAVLAELRDGVRRAGLGPDRVTLHQRAADDFTGVPDGSVDVVLVNSVVQYFPGPGYLVDVLRGAVRAVRPGGAVVLGDVRSRALLPVLYTSVALAAAGPDVPVPTLREAVRRRVSREEELVVDDELFRVFGRRHERVGEVSVLPKTGRRRNELFRFRYDVVLRVGDGPSAPPAPAREWAGPGELDAALREPGPDRLARTGVPDARLADDLLAADLVEHAGADTTVAGLRSALAEGRPPAVEPADLAADAAAAGYRAELFAAPGRPGLLDVVLDRHGTPAALPDPAADGNAAGNGDVDWSAFTNDPLRAARDRALVTHLRARLGERLPEYLVPGRFVLVDEWPVGPNGKLDRSALPRPDGTRPGTAPLYRAPRSATERTVATIWSDLLGMDRVGLDDDFFALGGHSLMATRVVAGIRQVTGVDVPVGSVLRTPVLRDVAALVDRLGAGPDGGAPAAAIPRADRSRYRGRRSR